MGLWKKIETTDFKICLFKINKANIMDPIIIGLLIALPFLYLMLVGGLSMLKSRRRKATVNNPTVNPVHSLY